MTTIKSLSSDEVKLDDVRKFKELKEKTIGTVIEYHCDFRDSYDDIINSKFLQKDQAFHAHLSEIKPLILDAFKRGVHSNLRTLIYFIQHYHQIYPNINHKLEKENKPLYEIQIRAVVRFSAVVSVEFKSGHLGYNERHGLNDLDGIIEHLKTKFAKFSLRHYNKLVAPSGQKSKIEQEKVVEYREVFLEKYFDDRNYEYFQSVYDFLTGGCGLNAALLKAEIQVIADSFQEPSAADSVFRKLSEPQVYDLTNQGYQHYTDQMLRHAHDGDYPLKRYINVFEYAMRFEEILTPKPAGLVDMLADAIDRNMDKFTYDIAIESSMRAFRESSAYSGNLKYLAEKINEANDAIPTNIEERNIENLLNVFLENPEAFYEKCTAEYKFKPVFHIWYFPAFKNRFDSLPTSQLSVFTDFMVKRYQNLSDGKWVEANFIDNLYNMLAVSSGKVEVSFNTVIKERLRTEIDSIKTSHYSLLGGEDFTK